MHEMTRLQAKAFRNRWQAVAAAEAEERRRTPLRIRWQQMNALLRLMGGLKLPAPLSEEKEKIVWERWAKMKERSR